MTKQTSFHYLDIIDDKPTRVKSVYSDGKKTQPHSDKCSCGKYSGGGKCWVCKQGEPIESLHFVVSEEDSGKIVK